MYIAFLLSLIPLAFLSPDLVTREVRLPFMPALGIHLHFGVDHLALIFLYLTSIIVPITILVQPTRPPLFYGLILLLQALLIGFFTSRDLVLFTFFFEAMLIPLYFLISTWGGPQREKAAFKFIIYMIAGSTLMVAGVLSLYFTANTFDLAQLAKAAPQTPIVAAIFLLAFAVKTPMFPFHAWLPDAYTQAPTAGTILLSALLSKAGIFGILRISLGIFPALTLAWSPILVTLAAIGVLYGAFAAWSQNDFKRLIAYSSFSHVNFILVGLFTWNVMAQSGAILQAVNHAITITGLFLVAGWLQMRIGTTHFGDVKGLAAYVPKLCWLTLFFVLSAVALPGLNTFVSEVMLLYGVFQMNWWLAALLGTTVILSVLYMLRWFQSVYFEEASEVVVRDIGPKDSLVALPLILLILWLGLYPGPAIKQVYPAADRIERGTQ